MTTTRTCLATLLTRIAIVLKGRALVEDVFDLNFAGGTDPDRPVRTLYGRAMWGCGHAHRPWAVT